MNIIWLQYYPSYPTIFTIIHITGYISTLSSIYNISLEVCPKNPINNLNHCHCMLKALTTLIIVLLLSTASASVCHPFTGMNLLQTGVVTFASTSQSRLNCLDVPITYNVFPTGFKSVTCTVQLTQPWCSSVPTPLSSKDSSIQSWAGQRTAALLHLPSRCLCLESGKILASPIWSLHGLTLPSAPWLSVNAYSYRW